jgi:hypothetical protein
METDKNASDTKLEKNGNAVTGIVSPETATIHL